MVLTATICIKHSPVVPLQLPLDEAIIINHIILCCWDAAFL